MINTVNVGGKELKLRASALTSFLYKKIFGKDILKAMTNIKETMEVDSILGLAYVMNLQAERPEILDDIMHGRATELTFFQWLDTFEYGDLISPDFVKTVTNTWINNQLTSTDSKNLNRPQ